jgi:hypothetical protein
VAGCVRILIYGSASWFDAGHCWNGNYGVSIIGIDEMDSRFSGAFHASGMDSAGGVAGAWFADASARDNGVRCRVVYTFVATSEY